MNLPERIETIVRDWPQWSRAERAKIDLVIEEVLDHCKNGTGNTFVREWCNRVLVPLIPEFVIRELDSASKSASEILGVKL